MQAAWNLHLFERVNKRKNQRQKHALNEPIQRTHTENELMLQLFLAGWEMHLARFIISNVGFLHGSWHRTISI